MNQIIIGVCGPARSGKGTFAGCAKDLGFYEDSFAAPIRAMLCHILNCSLEELEKIKEEPQSLLGGKTPRRAMQTLGTEWGRDTVRTDLWAASLQNRIKNLSMVVVSDVRFDNEAQLLKDMGGVIIKVERPTIRIAESNHRSEAGISEHLIDRIIINDSGLVQFTTKCFDVIYEIKNKELK